MPLLTREQREQLDHFSELARDLNRKLNLYSSASAADFERRHITHALTLASRPFPDDALVVDWGTGGGVPGIPLAIAFPDTEFVLVDAVDKKVRAVQTMIRRLGLQNATGWSGRAEQWHGALTHSVSRATAPLATLWHWHTRAHTQFDQNSNEAWKPGLVCLKGGDLKEEIATLEASHPDIVILQTSLTNLTTDSYFADKYIVEVTDGAA